MCEIQNMDGINWIPLSLNIHESLLDQNTREASSLICMKTTSKPSVMLHTCSIPKPVIRH